VGLVAEGEQVHIIADGPIDSVDAFQLKDPDRIVADFWGAQNAVFPDKFTVDTGSIQGVRIGQHADKVRVVMDLRVPIVSHVVEPAKKGVRIVLQGEGAIAEDDEALADFDAIPAAPEEEPKASTPRTPPTPGQTVWVKSVHFESLPGVDRVVLGIDGEVKAQVVAPDPVTWVIDLPGSRILSEVERRVDTREFRGPLEMFSVFQTPDVPIHQVRVVLKRRGQGKPRLTWEEGRLLIELPREGGTAFTPRATLPGEAPAAGSAPSSSAAGTQGPLGPVVGPHPTVLPSGVLPSGAPALAPGPMPASPFGTDPLLAGPADPASIDILEEGGFDDEKTYQGRRISLDFKDADIANILRLIAEVSDLNIIAGDEVEGKVTIRLVDVPWDQAMDVILLTKGLGFVRVGNVLRIAPLETLKQEKEARLMERRSKEKLEDLVVKLQPVNYASVKEMKDLIQRLLSPRGSVNVDERTNTLIIKDIPSVIHEATALVKAIDTQTPQVLIEAKIVEANLNFSRSLGANWGVGYTQPAGSTGGGQDLHLGDGTLDAVIPVADGTQQSNFISSNPVLGVLNGIMTLGILGLDDRIQLDLQLMAAESNNRGKVISSPRIVTLDNREAVIKQGVAIKFTEITRDTVTTSFVDAVLELKVTPHITANRSIIMKLKVSRNAPQLSTASGDVVGIAKNETETEALVRDGETMVLGGIYVVDNGKTTTKFPFLADIPLLGTAFRSNSIQDERRELLIFVTPRIVTSPSSDL
jgi:type IV pilus assembly protein PilQ